MAGKVGNMSRERAIVDLVARQQGLLTHVQLASLGVGRRTIERWVASGRLRSVHRDVYAFGPRPLTRHGKWLAAVLAMGPDAFLSHRTAAALWRLAGDRPKVDVTAPRGKQVRPGRKGIQVHRCQFEPDEVTMRDGIPVSTVARTLFDLAERSQPYELKNAWDEASRLRVLRVPEVAAVYERGRGRRARTRIRPFLLAEQRYVEDTASPLEDRFAAFVVDHRLPPPQTNVDTTAVPAPAGGRSISRAASRRVTGARFWRSNRRVRQGRRPEGVAEPRRAVEDAAGRGEGQPERANVARRGV
jgi:hypothetical protein